jgi:hypothetical protein
MRPEGNKSEEIADVVVGIRRRYEECVDMKECAEVVGVSEVCPSTSRRPGLG